MLLNELQGDQRKRISDHYETFLHSLALLRGDRLSADQVSRIVGEAVAGASPEELRSSVPPASAIGRLQQLLAQTVESGRPRNMYGADAARAAQAAGGATGQRFGDGPDAFGGRPGSSARYREIASDGSRRSGGADAAAASGYASAASLNYVSAASFGRTPFAAAGMNYGTFAYVRGQDRALTGQNLLHAVDDAGKLGFGANDKEAIRDHAVIDHYSRDPRHANTALQDYDHRKHADAELDQWVREAAQEKNPAKRAELDGRIKERRQQHRQESGVQEHIDHDHPKGGAAVRNRANRLDMRDGEGATLGRMRKVGVDAVRDADYADRRAALSGAGRQRAAKAEQAQAASSAAKKDTARTADRLSLLAMAGDGAAPRPPEKPASPAADAVKPTAEKSAEPKKADPAPAGGKADAKADHPAKPAAPVRTRMASAAGPSVG